jgi:hypothetical protein
MLQRSIEWPAGILSMLTPILLLDFRLTSSLNLARVLCNQLSVPPARHINGANQSAANNAVTIGLKSNSGGDSCRRRIRESHF